MPKRKYERVKVEMIFDRESGELVDVKALEGKKTKLGKTFNIKQLDQANLKKFTQHAFLYGWGSPGCAIYCTSRGYIRICW